MKIELNSISCYRKCYIVMFTKNSIINDYNIEFLNIFNTFFLDKLDFKL
jgi:hypothetical protein